MPRIGRLVNSLRIIGGHEANSVAMVIPLNQWDSWQQLIDKNCVSPACLGLPMGILVSKNTNANKKRIIDSTLDCCQDHFTRLSVYCCNLMYHNILTLRFMTLSILKTLRFWPWGTEMLTSEIYTRPLLYNDQFCMTQTSKCVRLC